MQILHTPHCGTSVCVCVCVCVCVWGGGEGGDGTPSKSFWYVAVFRTDFAFSGKSLSSNSLNKMRYV